MSHSVAGGLSATLTKLTDLGDLLGRMIVQHERSFVVSTIALFVFSATNHALTAPLWFDEFFTLFLSRLSSLSVLLHAVPADGMPPLQYFLTALSLRLFGETEFGLRALDLVSYLIAGTLVYRIVRRHAGAVPALFALALLMGSALVHAQASVARPYELLLAFSSLTFYSFQVAGGNAQHRSIALCGIAFGLGGSILTHHYGIIQTGSFLFVGEFVRTIRRRKVDAWMLAAIGVGMSALVVTVPLVRQSTELLGEPIKHSTIFWAQPKALDLWTYLEMFPLELVLYVVVFGLLMRSVRMHQKEDEPVAHVPVYEWAAAGTLCLLLPMQFAIARSVTGYFQPRYAIGTSLGLAIVGGWTAARFQRIAQPLVALSTFVFLVLAAISLVVEQANGPVWAGVAREQAVSPLLQRAPVQSVPGDLPIVVANAFDYVPDWWYSSTEMRDRLIYLSDVSFAVKQRDFLPELSLVAERDYTPLHIYDYSSFIASHQHFLLLVSGLKRLVWINSRLAQAGWRLTPIGTAGGDTLYEVDGR
jgi:hypothetical protein